MPTNAEITEVFLGGAYAQELYLGGTRIWPTGTVGVASTNGYVIALRSNGTPVFTEAASWYPSLLNIPSITRGNTTMVSFGERHAMALLKDKTVVCWGENNWGQRNTPANLTNVKSIFGAGYSSFAILEDGTVRHWGQNSQGNGNIPAGLTNVISISTAIITGGGAPVVAVKSDGTVVVWGSSNQFGATNVPAGLNRIIKSSSVYQGSIVLRDDGVITSWGSLSVPSSVDPTDLVDIALRDQYRLYVLRINGDVELNNTVVATGVVAMSPSGTAILKQDGTTQSTPM